MKKILVCSISILLVILIWAVGSGANTDETPFVSDISRADAIKNSKAYRICLTLKNYASIEDAVIDTEADPIQVNIVLSDACLLPPEEKEVIEDMIDAVFPDAIVDYAAQ